MAKKTANNATGSIVNLSGVYDPLPGVEEIEQFIEQAGSDNLPAFGGKFEGGIHIQQIPDELAACIAGILFSGCKAKSYLEIGSASGGTAYVFNYYFEFDQIVLIDLNTHPKAQYRREILAGIDRREIVGRSTDALVLQAVAELNQKFDIIMIDGDHEYPAVKADVENYLPYLNEGGFLILHDSAPRHLGIIRVVGELKQSGEVEFVAEYTTQKHTSPCGIAVFRKVAKE